MEKQVRNFKIDYELDWEYGIEISKIRKDLDELEKLGATHVEIESDEDYGCAFTIIHAHAERIETDEEFKDRVSKEEARKQSRINRELEVLKILEMKYPNRH